MAVKSKPDGYPTVIPYLLVEDIEKMISFLSDVFGAEVKEKSETPRGIHAEVRIGESAIMMGSSNASFEPTRSMIYIYVDNVDEVFQRALACGATSIMEPADAYYGDRNGGVRGPLGNLWWIATHVEDVSSREIARRIREQHGSSA